MVKTLLSFRILKMFIFFLFVILSNVLIAQNTGTFRGFVKDSSNGEALAFANILIKELDRGTTSDFRGYFIIPKVPSGNRYTVIISYVGYRSKKIKIAIKKNKITETEAFLSPVSIEIGSVEKTAEKISEENVTNIGVQRIPIKQLEALPKSVELDIFRAIQYLPGVQSTSDISARLFVRGGASNQNLFLLDDIPIYNPYHALGLFGAIDPEVINNVEIHLGGFSSEYAGRLSSVVKMNAKEGNNRRYNATLGASLLSFKGSLQGPYSKGSFILSARKSNNNKILGKFLNDKNVPINFYDMFFKGTLVDTAFMPGGKFSVIGFFSGDKISNNPTLADVKWANSAIGFKWFQVTKLPMFYTVLFSVTNFFGEITPKLSKVKPLKNNLIDYTAKVDLSYVYDSKDELKVGLKIKEVTTSLILKNSLGITSDIGQSEFANANLSVYAQYKILRFDKFMANIGSRINLAGLSRGGNTRYFEPRASLSYQPVKQFAIKLAWGLYQQEITTLTDEDDAITFFEPWFITPLYLTPSRAIHYIAGIEMNLNNSLLIDLEGYYKIEKNIPTLNDKKIFSDDPDLVAGKSISYGVDFLLRYSHRLFSFSSSYSLAWASKEVNGNKYRPRFDIRHSLKFHFLYKLPWGIKASATWLFNSGLPFTRFAGYYDKLYLDSSPNLFSIFGSQIPSPLLEGRNVSRLPFYHRLDIGLSKKFDISRFKIYLDLSLINLYDRKNIFYFDRENGKRINMLPFLPTATIKVEL